MDDDDEKDRFIDDDLNLALRHHVESYTDIWFTLNQFTRRKKSDPIWPIDQHIPIELNELDCPNLNDSLILFLKTNKTWRKV